MQAPAHGFHRSKTKVLQDLCQRGIHNASSIIVRASSIWMWTIDSVDPKWLGFAFSQGAVIIWCHWSGRSAGDMVYRRSGWCYPVDAD